MMEMNPVGKETERFFGNVDVPDGGYVGNADSRPILRADHANAAWNLEGSHMQNAATYTTAKSKLTAIGGFAVLLTNESGADTVAGQLVHADLSTDDAVDLTAADDEECFGVFLDAGVADGSEAWVVVAGIADVAMEDNTAATRGNWVRTSITEAGYADATNAAPPGGGIPELDRHMKEIGHCLESVSDGGAGTHILARCILHFN